VIVYLVTCMEVYPIFKWTGIEKYFEGLYIGESFLGLGIVVHLLTKLGWSFGPKDPKLDWKKLNTFPKVYSKSKLS
jgi:hypothetical protein